MQFTFLASIFITWSINSGYNLKGQVDDFLEYDMNSSLYRDRNLSLKDTVIRATAPEGNLTQGEIVFETIDNGQLRYKSGFGVDILYSLQIALGFQIKVITAKSWATQFPNGSWFGMAQQIIDDEADLSLAKTSILPNRAAALSYLTPTHGLGLYAFFVQPPSNAGHNIFFEPFSLELWICLLSLYVTLVFGIQLIAFLLSMPISDVYMEERDVVFVNQAPIWVLHAICQHGFHSLPKLNCFRIAVISGIILGLVVYLSYSAQLVSMFSVQTIPIKNMMDLVKSQINIFVDRNNLAAINMIQESSSTKNSKPLDPIALRLRAHLKNQKKTTSTAQEGGENVLGSLGAFITFKDTFYTTTKNTFGTEDDEFCDKVYTLPVTTAKFKSGLFVKKKSKLKEPFNVIMTAMYTSGLMQRFVTKYEETYTPSCNQEKMLRSAPVITLDDVITAFFILLGGTTTALLISIVEKIISYYLNLNQIYIF